MSNVTGRSPSVLSPVGSSFAGAAAVGGGVVGGGAVVVGDGDSVVVVVASDVVVGAPGAAVVVVGGPVVVVTWPAGPTWTDGSWVRRAAPYATPTPATSRAAARTPPTTLRLRRWRWSARWYSESIGVGATPVGAERASRAS